MEAMHIAAERGLPKELLQRVQLLEVLAAQPLKLKYDSSMKFQRLLYFWRRLKVFILLDFKNLQDSLQRYDIFLSCTRVGCFF
jgi:hypothetical protein